MNKTYVYISGGVIIVLAVLVAVWFVFFTGTPITSTTNTTNNNFGQSNTRTNVTANPGEPTNQQEPVISTNSTQQIFKISDGPVAGAILIESSRPTTTVARYAMADSGHMFDIAVDSPGSVAKAISNTTIPGITEVRWSESGRGVLMQYLDNSVVKTAHFALPGVASSSVVKVQFLQNDIASLAVSPDGTSVAYLIKTPVGADGYTATVNGSGVKKLFSLPLSQVTLRWPAAATLLAVSAPAAGVSGGAFSIDTKSGAASPLLFADGLSAIADRTFSRIIYQTVGAERGTYSLNTNTGVATPLSFDPLPEQCLFSAASSTVMYCAAPLQYVPANYMDLRHQGLSAAQEGIFSFNLNTLRAQLLAMPGSDGGEPSEIADMSVSPRGDYAVFIRRGDRSLWGVRLEK